MSNRKNILDWIYLTIMGIGSVLMITGITLAVQAFVPGM